MVREVVPDRTSRDGRVTATMRSDKGYEPLHLRCELRY